MRLTEYAGAKAVLYTPPQGARLLKNHDVRFVNNTDSGPQIEKVTSELAKYAYCS